MKSALFGKAVSLQLLWKFDEATALYLKILEKNPQSEECLVNLITIGMARKDHASIQQYSERLLTMRPFSQAALEGLATCAFHANDYRSRLALLRQAGGVHAGSLRALVQPGRGGAEVQAPAPRPPKPIRKRCASVPTPSRPT